MRPVILLALSLLPTLAYGQADHAIRNAITRALPPLQRSAATFIEKRACFSCHHNTLPILTLHLAQDRDFRIDARVLASVEEKTLRELRNDRALENAVQATDVHDPTPNDSLLLMAAEAAGQAPELPFEIYARRIASWQRDGHWITSDFRPPHSSSLFTATATAVRAIRAYMPPELNAERDARLHAAAEWLASTQPQSTEDASFRLMGLVWAGAPRTSIETAQQDLLARRNKNNAWPQIPGYVSDAYSTGQAVYALRESGVPASDTALQQALRFLTASQAVDGTWHVRSRMVSPAEVSPPYFETGFPYKKDQFISYAGSIWATMALLSSLPATRPPTSQALPALPTASTASQRAALFGTQQALTRLLDAGLDPNQQTANGVTLLMMAAADREKVRLLLARGANVKARTKGNIDALTIAASYYGNAASVEVLLNAGAEAKIPESIHNRNTPLGFATMSGDLGTVKLLLAHGADPANGYPLAEAVTFNHPEVAQALIAAGSSVTGVESTGINLLHWATITNRPKLIPILARAGVPLNDQDDNGYTPLMYAASIDFGDRGVLDALINLGANPAEKDFRGRTALQHATLLGNLRLADALKQIPKRRP